MNVVSVLSLFGRKKGRKLSNKKTTLVKNLLPKISLEEMENLQSLLTNKAPIFLELGFGQGENLVKLSLERPEWKFLGVDPYINGVASLLEKIDSKKIENIFILHGDGRKFVKTLPENIVSEACILFPDPWQKSKHISRRLIQQELITDLSKIMISKSRMHISSDDPKAQEWILKNLSCNSFFEWKIKNTKNCYIKPKIFEDTKYMLKAIKAKRKPMWLNFENRKEP